VTTGSVDETIQDAPALETSSADASARDRVQRLRRRLERLVGVAATEGNEVTVLRNGDEIFPAMLDAIKTAEHTIDMMTFVYWRGDIAHEFANALAERSRAGLRVRLLLDGIGARDIEGHLLDDMDTAGVEISWFRKPLWISPLKQNHRCHRKALIIDEETAFTGGVGIAEEWCGDARNRNEWRDTHVRVRGPAVDAVAAAFAQNWAECCAELFDDHDRFTAQPAQGGSIIQVVRSSASLGWQDMQTLLHVMLTSARRRFRLTTAYFAPDDHFAGLLADAARRGVRVEILLPGPHTDQRTSQLAGQRHYADLLAAGVDIRQFEPTMMHAKVITVDGIASLTGSTNFNRRSMEHDEEVMLTVLDEQVTATLDEHFDDDLLRSEAIDLTRWQRRPVPQRLLEKAVAPIKRFL
jgi:cardiolipin synthase